MAATTTKTTQLLDFADVSGKEFVITRGPNKSGLSLSLTDFPQGNRRRVTFTIGANRTFQIVINMMRLNYAPSEIWELEGQVRLSSETGSVTVIAELSYNSIDRKGTVKFGAGGTVDDSAEPAKG